MKNISLVILVFSLAACAAQPKKEYDWFKSDGTPASEQEVNDAKEVCGYKTKMRSSADELILAQSIGRYSTTSPEYKQHVANATNLVKEATDCLKSKGLSTKERSAQ